MVGKWREKLEREYPSHGKIVGILIPKPMDLDSLIRTVPEGYLVTDEQLRTELARRSGADVACSKVTGIFLRICAEAAEEDRAEGREGITPYWRVISKDGSLKPKFPGGVESQSFRLKGEGHQIVPGGGKKPPAVKDFQHALVDIGVEPQTPVAIVNVE
ncbi:MAG: MGMT family protein [Methanomassiliicoccales archaeon]|nr:MGMT family protein [Methanomassiliicoccales archaeon]